MKSWGSPVLVLAEFTRTRLRRKRDPRHVGP
jgi:hypothetical protein